MRAIVLHGEDLRLEERPDPVPGSNELVVAQPYAAVNPADLAQRCHARDLGPLAACAHSLVKVESEWPRRHRPR